MARGGPGLRRAFVRDTVPSVSTFFLRDGRLPVALPVKSVYLMCRRAAACPGGLRRGGRDSDGVS